MTGALFIFGLLAAAAWAIYFLDRLGTHMERRARERHP